MRTIRKISTSQQSGFTLVEVAIAIGILAVMSVLNYNMIINFVETKSEIDDQRELVFVANSILGRLTKELQLAVKTPKLPPPCDNPTAQRQNAVMLGQNSGMGPDGPTLVFSAKDAGQHIHNGNSHSGTVQITYKVAQDPEQRGSKDGGMLLIRDEIPNRPPFDLACKDAIRFPITKRLVNLEFKFFDKNSAEWTNEWSGQRAANLPDIIQFTLSLKSDKGRISTYTSAVSLLGQ